MTVSILVPYTTDCPQRAEIWAWLRDRYLDLGYEVVEGHCDGPWCKATAVADALTRATGDVLAVADADVWADGIQETITAVAGGARWGIPHRYVHRLTHHATRQTLAGEPLTRRLKKERAAYTGIPGGGLVVLTRSCYQQVPLDPRFVGWGGEDVTWGMALSTLVGTPWRSKADLFHLWHPAPGRGHTIYGPPEHRDLYRRYKAALNDRDAMWGLIGEAACQSTVSSSVPSPS